MNYTIIYNETDNIDFYKLINYYYTIDDESKITLKTKYYNYLINKYKLN